MGQAAPPYYGIETIMQHIDEISKIDEKINELQIVRENHVETLKQAIEAERNKKA